MSKLLYRLFWNRATTTITMNENIYYKISGTLFGVVSIIGRNEATGKNFGIKISQEEALDEDAILNAIDKLRAELLSGGVEK